MNNDFLSCPKCHSQNWVDIPNTTDSLRTRFRCYRCDYLVRVEICKNCNNKNWELIKGIEDKGGHRPYYRFKCRSCNRVLKIKISS